MWTDDFLYVNTQMNLLVMLNSNMLVFKAKSLLKRGHGGQFSNHWKVDNKKIPLDLLTPLYVFTLKHQNKNFSSGMHVL